MKRFERNPLRELPDGTITNVFPFHVSLKGLESKVLCRDDSDYDVFVKYICICARRKNVILVIYAVVSNHAHCVIMAHSQAEADAFAQDVKKVYSMYCARKYGDNSVMKGMDASAIWLDSDSYLRNAIAYVVRNAMDNGAKSIQEYKWTGFRAMFCGGKPSGAAEVRRVRDLTKMETRQIMHTGDKLGDVRWLINEDDELEPASICDWRYVEEAFLGEQSFFLWLVGGVNNAEMTTMLEVAPRTKRTDSELLVSINEIAQRWFKKDVSELSQERKARLLSYVYHAFRSDPSQLARTFELSREFVLTCLRKRRTSQ